MDKETRNMVRDMAAAVAALRKRHEDDGALLDSIANAVDVLHDQCIEADQAERKHPTLRSVS